MDPDLEEPLLLTGPLAAASKADLQSSPGPLLFGLLSAKQVNKHTHEKHRKELPVLTKYKNKK